VGDLLEVEHPGVERDRTVHVGHRERDRTDRGDRGRPRRQRDPLAGAGLLGPERRGAERQRQDNEARELHCKRSRMWSPTRSALAMMVRAGFTAPLDGKKRSEERRVGKEWGWEGGRAARKIRGEEVTVVE